MTKFQKKKTIDSLSSNRLSAWDYLIQVFFTGKVNDEMRKSLMNIGYEDLDKKLLKKTNLITGKFIYQQNNNDEQYSDEC